MGNYSNSKQVAWLGIVLVALGGYFLLRNFDLIPFFLPYWLFKWQMILVLIGSAMWITGRKEGIVFLVIGTFFLLPHIFGFYPFRVRDWWPLILIVMGVVIFVRRRDYNRMAQTQEDNSDYFFDSSIFGGSSKSFTSKNFQGGKVTSVFGGSEIDFSETEMAMGDAVLDIFCLFGGNEMRIPNDWTVVNDCFVLFGGFEDKRKLTSETDPEKVLRIKGSIVFGGTSLRSA